jgi:acetyltransferase-like isoleucine patch superfamily enzyme
MSFSHLILNAIKSPKKCLDRFYALMRGTYYLTLYRIISNRIRIDFPFYAYAPVTVLGPGTVVIGKSTMILLNNYKGLTIVTESPDSVVNIGEKCLLGGLTIRCRGTVSIGDKVMSALSLIQDSYYGDAIINTQIYKRNSSGHKEISIGNNVWIGAQCIISGGCRIGNDSVLSFGTCCHNMDVGEYKLVAGNPARRPLPIDNVLQLTGMK